MRLLGWWFCRKEVGYLRHKTNFQTDVVQIQGISLNLLKILGEAVRFSNTDYIMSALLKTEYKVVILIAYVL